MNESKRFLALNMKKLLLPTFGLAAVAFGMSSCLKVEVLPDEPQITFETLQTYQDSAVLVIGFQDGDGDVGLDQGDTF